MDPLTDLTVLNNWHAFEPSKKGYLPPCTGDIDRMHVHLSEHVDSYYIRPNDAKVANLTIHDDSPYPGIMTAMFGFPTLPCGSRIDTPQNPRWNSFVNKAGLASVDPLRINLKNYGTPSFRLDRFATYSPQDQGAPLRISTERVSHAHVATLCIILPGFNPQITFTAVHDGQTTTLSNKEDLGYSTTVIAMYTGLSNASVSVEEGTNTPLAYFIYHLVVTKGEVEVPLSVPLPRLENLSGAIPELRDVFRTWRYAVDSGILNAPTMILILLKKSTICPGRIGKRLADSKDTAKLAHFAPLIKGYGFRFVIASVEHEEFSIEQQVHHEYKKYLGSGWDTSVEAHTKHLKMGDAEFASMKWCFTAIDGACITGVEYETLEAQATTMVEMNRYYGGVIQRLPYKRDVDVVDDSCYTALVQLKHSRNLQFICILP